MKKILTTILLALATTLPGTAQESKQTLIVYEVSGNVLKIAKTERPVLKRQGVALSDKLSIPEDGFVKLIDKQQQKMYTLRNKCRGSIATLIAQQKDSSKNLTKQYFAYILKSLTRKDTDGLYNTGLTTGIYRNDADSLLCDIDSLQSVVDSLQNVITTLTTDSVKKK